MAVLRNISYFLLASVLSKPLGFLLSLILARSLDPADFGVWVSLLLVVSYTPIAGLGTVETVLKLVPYYLGRGEHQSARDVENSVMGAMLLSGGAVIAVALVIAAMPHTLWGFHPPLLATVLVASAVSFVSGYFYNRLAAYENFKAVGTVELLRTFFALVFTGGLAWQWKLPGAVAGYLLHEVSTCACVALINFKAHGRVGINFRKDLLISAVRVGFPITLLWWVLTLTGTVDRVILGSLLGPVAVGHYSLALSLVGVLYLIPTAVGRVLYPKVNKQLGQNQGVESMKQVVLGPTLALGALLANIQLIVFVGMPYLYNELLPKYQPGLLSGQILILGSFFACLMRNGANYLIAINQERVFLKYILVTLVFNLLGDFLLIKLGFGISGVAFGTSFAGALLSSMVWRKVFLALGFSPRRSWVAMAGLYLPNLLLIGAMVVTRSIDSQAFLHFNLSTLICGMLFVFALNGALYCFPLYRNESKRWKNTLLEIKKSLFERSQLRKLATELDREKL